MKKIILLGCISGLITVSNGQSYLPLTGGTLSGGLTTPSLSVTNGYINGVSIGTGSVSNAISYSNLNNLTATGFYRGCGLVNGPDNGWWYVVVESHDNSGGTVAGWTKQTATAYGSSNNYSPGTTFIRNQAGSSTWAPWSMIQFSGQPITVTANSLPEFGGSNQSFIGSNLQLVGTSSGRTVGTGPSLTFAFPAFTDGTNIWEQARILATPDNVNNYNAQGRLYFQVRDLYNPGLGGNWNWRTGLMIQANGNVLIGKTTQTNFSYILDVAGNIRANKLVVNTTGADFVFAKKYHLIPLKELEKYIQQNKHLPGVEPAKEISKEGVDVGKNETKLLQKIEELTLYMIELKKENEEMYKRISNQQSQINLLKKQVKQ